MTERLDESLQAIQEVLAEQNGNPLVDNAFLTGVAYKIFEARLELYGEYDSREEMDNAFADWFSTHVEIEET